LGEFRASWLVENGGEALLGTREIFDREQNHGTSEPAWAALPAESPSAEDPWPENKDKTWRARSAFSVMLLMTVLAQWTRSPGFRRSSAALASR
jgi:hypothetical protein